MNRSTSTDLQRFIAHLPLQSTDRVLVVLKGHLLIEELLREYVNHHVRNPESLQDARLTFHQALCLARAFAPEESKEKLWNSVDKLNSLRNKIAHSLEPKDLEAKLKEFVEFLSNADPDVSHLDPDRTFGILSSCILAICLSLSEALRQFRTSSVADHPSGTFL